MMYELIVELTVAEELEFKLKGHLDALARDICSNEKKYNDRLLKPNNPYEKIEFVNSI